MDLIRLAVEDRVGEGLAKHDDVGQSLHQSDSQGHIDRNRMRNVVGQCRLVSSLHCRHPHCLLLPCHLDGQVIFWL